jgi:cytidylate kinase
MGFIIAIDGTASAGKSTTARLVAERLGFVNLNTGSLYRAATYVLLEHGVVDSSDAEVMRVLESAPLEFRIEKSSMEVYYNGRHLRDELRTPKVDAWVSKVSSRIPVRKFMLGTQRRIGEENDVVCEGRDIGSYVFPRADLKVFMSCDLEQRAKRRLKEDETRGIKEGLPEIRENLEERDYNDTHKGIYSLTRLPDSFVVDTTHLTIEQQVGIVEKEARRRMAARHNKQ